jgi:hypothetical protein
MRDEEDDEGGETSLAEGESAGGDQGEGRRVEGERGQIRCHGGRAGEERDGEALLLRLDLWRCGRRWPQQRPHPYGDKQHPEGDVDQRLQLVVGGEPRVAEGNPDRAEHDEHDGGAGGHR